MRPVFHLQITLPHGGPPVLQGGSALRQPVRVTLPERWRAEVDAACERLSAEQARAQVLVRGLDLRVTQAEDRVGALLGQALRDTPELAVQLGRALGEAQGETLLLAVDARDGLEALPWELLAPLPHRVPIEAHAEAVVARLLPGAPVPVSQAVLPVAVRVWRPAGADPVLDSVGAHLAQVARRAGVDLGPCEGATPPPGVAPVLVLLAHGRRVASALQLDGTQAGPGSVAHALAAHVRGAELVVLAVCDSGAEGATEGWAGRLLEAGARAVVAPSGPLRVEAANAFLEGLVEALGLGLSVPDAVMAGRRAVRGLAHPAQACRWHRLRFAISDLGGWPAHARGHAPLDGWPAPGPDAKAVLDSVWSLAEEQGSSFLGLEHLILAWGRQSPVPGPLLARRILPAAARAAEERLAQFSALSAGTAPRPTPRLLRMAAHLPPGFDLARLWQALAAEGGPVLGILTEIQGWRPRPPEGPPPHLGGVPTEEFPPVDALATGLEVLTGPEDGRQIWPQPGQIIGRVSADGDNDIGLYAGLEHADTRLSRRHLQWRAPGQLRTLRPTPELGANADLRVSVGSVTRVTTATLLLGIGPRT